MKQNTEILAKEALALFRDYLAHQGLNFSQPRAIIMSHVVRFGRHFGAEELVKRLRNGEERVARGTVYRTLGLLEHAGLVRKIHGHGGHRYELVLGDTIHDHLFCEQCGRTFEFQDDSLPEAVRRASHRHCFAPRIYSVEVLGTCSECTESEGAIEE
jgi:Fur family transcriptional regulator, ferric uptake regulator